MTQTNTLEIKSIPLQTMTPENCRNSRVI